jgi:hypothetical protein
LQVETSLHEETRTTNGATSATTSLTPNAVRILRITKGAAWENATTTNVRFPNEFEKFVALQGRLHTSASTTKESQTEVFWCLTRRFEETNLPLTSQICGELLLDWH